MIAAMHDATSIVSDPELVPDLETGHRPGRDDDIAVTNAIAGDHSRLVTIVGTAAARDAGFQAIGGNQAESAAYRDSVRGELVDLAGAGDLVVPVSETFLLRQAVEALELVMSGRAGGKVALVPDSNDV